MSTPQKPPHVLCVDDYPDNLHVIGHILRRLGYTHDEATNGTDALKLLENTRFDIALLDIEMPGMSGYELIRRIRAHPNPAISQIPAVAVTAYGSSSNNKEKALNSGFTAFFPKPVMPRELRVLMASLNLETP